MTRTRKIKVEEGKEGEDEGKEGRYNENSAKIFPCVQNRVEFIFNIFVHSSDETDFYSIIFYFIGNVMQSFYSQEY